MKHLISSLAAVAFGITVVSAAINPQPSPLQVTYGNLETFTIYSPEMERDFIVDVLLPEGYSANTMYPVVYMHDGQNLFDAESTWNKQAWEMDEAVSRLEGIKPIIVGVYVVPDTRYGDLMPADPLTLINDSVVAKMISQRDCKGVKGDKYVDFLATTLKNEIDGHYSTLTEPEHTSVMGSSMGGLASFYAMCRHPETFGAAACISTHLVGTLGQNEVFPTAFAAYLLKNLPIDGKHRIYFDTGDQTLDAQYTPYFGRLMQMITEMGMPEELFMYKTFPGHAHDENSWKSRVDIPLNFILAK